MQQPNVLVPFDRSNPSRKKNITHISQLVFLVPADDVERVDSNPQYPCRIVCKNEPILLDSKRHEYVANRLQPNRKIQEINEGFLNENDYAYQSNRLQDKLHIDKIS